MKNCEFCENKHSKLAFVSLSELNENMIYVTEEVYERIASHPNKIIIESQCKAPLILKVEGWGEK